MSQLRRVVRRIMSIFHANACHFTLNFFELFVYFAFFFSNAKNCVQCDVIRGEIDVKQSFLRGKSQ